MTSKRIAQTNQQQKSDKPQGSGILQRAAVRSVADTGVEFEEQEARALSNSAFSYDFSRVQIRPVQKKQQATPNQTGLPDEIKAGVENLSGYSLHNVRVHYNSPKPAQLQALAYTQGTEIHVASGQEEHLPHEAWHVVQQMQGRVKPTMQMKGVQINEDLGLEREADVMGAKVKEGISLSSPVPSRSQAFPGSEVSQLRKIVMPHGEEIVTERYTSDKLREVINNYSMTPESEQQLAELKDAIEAGEVEDQIFTDSESDSDDPTYAGLRIMNESTRKDLAEFDRVRLGRKKIYEDKLAEFNQKNVPSEFQKPESELIKQWIQKQVEMKVTKKLRVIEDSTTEKTVRSHENTNMTREVAMQWVNEVRKFKIVVSTRNDKLKEELAQSVVKLRQEFPLWTITAKMGDPKAREDHDNMHKIKH